VVRKNKSIGVARTQALKVLTSKSPTVVGPNRPPTIVVSKPSNGLNQREGGSHIAHSPLMPLHAQGKEDIIDVDGETKQ
jgi:hypothetical protein